MSVERVRQYTFIWSEYLNANHNTPATGRHARRIRSLQINLLLNSR
jgi:hypothetical protein